MAVLAPRRSLKSRAIQLLAQREHSRVELQRKLMAHARAEVREATPTAQAAADADASDDAGESQAQAAQRVADLLDWLEAQGHLSPQRFLESRVHARSGRFGNLRIRQELAQHAMALPAEAVLALNGSELERARTVLARKYKAAPHDSAEQARRARFLASRGFSPETIRQALRRASTEDTP